MKTCPHCGKELPNEMQFCPYCMHKLIAERSVGGMPTKRRPWPWIVGGTVALILLCALLAWGYGCVADRRPSASEPIDDAAELLVDGDGVSKAPTGGTTDKSASTTTAPATGTTATAPATGTTASEGASSSAKESNEKTTASTADKSKGKSTTTSGDNVQTPVGSSSVGRSTTTTAAPCASGHTWEEITQAVEHDEVGHYEEVVTGYNTVTVYQCAVCYDRFDSLERYYTHFDDHLATSDALVAIFRDRYTTSQEQQPIYGNQWVVDEKAYTEWRVIGRKCRVCGKTEYNK